MNVFLSSLAEVSSSAIIILSSYVPRFIAGVIILTIGLIVAGFLKDIVNILFKYFKVESWLEEAGIATKKDVKVWPNIIAELVRWTTIFLFLISTVEVWGVPKVADVLNQLLLFIPNVFVAVVIGLVGIVTSKFAFDIVRHGVRGLGSKEAVLLGNVAKYAIIFFSILIILTQLGVAADLVKILFTGIVGMLALAGGLAFGLGGQEFAKDILKKLEDRLTKDK